MTDRELLELAAKAAGEKVYAVASQEKNGTVTFYKEPELFYWNPLTDDGDALRLAVKLQIDLVHFNGHLRADVKDMPDVHELHNSDPYAATRRAIVRAAAAIGKAMK